MRLHMRWGLIILGLALFCQNTLAYDPCDPRNGFGTIAENRCYRLSHALDTGVNFTLSAVKLSKEIATAETRDDIVLIPGGPGTDAQALALSLNKKSILDVLWNSLNLNVVLFDPRGTGRSLLPQSAEFYSTEVFATDRQVGDLKAVVDAVSPNKPVYLLAHSAGGDLAARYAALFPARVKGLILYSASIDTREIGESNLRLFAKDFPFFDQHVQTCAPAEATRLKQQQVSIEKFLRNVLKLQRIKKIRIPQLQSRFYLKDFRVEMITAIENDSHCGAGLSEVLNKWEQRIATLPSEVQNQVQSLAPLQFDPATNEIPTLTRGTWIKTAVICSEGITKKEMLDELWIEGINFSQDTCQKVNAVYDVPPSRAWLAKITAPTLLIGGTLDPFQIPSAVMRNAQAISGSQVVLIKGGGHESHLNSPMEFYKALEKFFQTH